MHRRATPGPHFILGQARPTGACRSTQTLGCSECQPTVACHRAPVRAESFKAQDSGALARRVAQVQRTAARQLKAYAHSPAIARERSGSCCAQLAVEKSSLWHALRAAVPRLAIGSRGCRRRRQPRLGRRCGSEKRSLSSLSLRVMFGRIEKTSRRFRPRSATTASKQAKFEAAPLLQMQQPNPSFERTCTGVPRLALISFWARRVPPAPAAQLKR